MFETSLLLITGSALAAFFASFAWYIIFAKQRANVSGVDATRPGPIKIAGEFVKNIVLAIVVSYFVSSLGIDTWLKMLHLVLILWIGFPALILISSVMYEKVPLKLAAIHAGDWLLKLLLMISILGFWN